jgi:hypothetical protein
MVNQRAARGQGTKGAHVPNLIRGALICVALGCLAGCWLAFIVVTGVGDDHRFLDDLDDL